MKKKYLLLSAGFLILVGAFAAYWWFLWPIKEVENQVRSALKDPDSAKFEDVTFYRKNKTGCGMVNAKNSMGGYVGNTMFIATPNEVNFSPKTDSDSSNIDKRIEAAQKRLEFLELAEKLCSNK